MKKIALVQKLKLKCVHEVWMPDGIRHQVMLTIDPDLHPVQRAFDALNISETPFSTAHWGVGTDYCADYEETGVTLRFLSDADWSTYSWLLKNPPISSGIFGADCPWLPGGGWVTRDWHDQSTALYCARSNNPDTVLIHTLAIPRLRYTSGWLFTKPGEPVWFSEHYDMLDKFNKTGTFRKFSSYTPAERAEAYVEVGNHLGFDKFDANPVLAPIWLVEAVWFEYSPARRPKQPPLYVVVGDYDNSIKAIRETKVSATSALVNLQEATPGKRYTMYTYTASILEE